jgi:hypothetical protein
MSPIPKIVTMAFAALLLIATETNAMRWYSPNTGRWLSRDPLAERGGLNIYEYVLNDAINYFDYIGNEASSSNPRLKPVSGGAGATGYQDENGSSQNGFFLDIAGGRNNPNVRGFSNGKELLDQMERLSKNNCCIKTFSIATHGRGSPRPSLPSSENGPNGFFAPDDKEYQTRGVNSRSTEDLQEVVNSKQIIFCKPCLIQFYGCNLVPLIKELSRITGCRIVAAGGFCSPQKRGSEWLSDDWIPGKTSGDQWYESTGGKPPTPIPGGAIYVPQR